MGTSLENKAFKKSKNFNNISWCPSPILLTEKKSVRFLQFSTPKNDFENQNFAIFEEALNNFGRFDDDMVR